MPGRRVATPVETTKMAIATFDEAFAALPLAGKLAHISGMLSNVPKNGYNRAQNYHFTQETDLVAAIRPFLAAAGIVIIPTVTAHEMIEIGDTRSGGKNRLTIITVDYTITDGKESLEGTVVGYGADTGDKGVYKAMTGAMKYVLMKVFMVDTGDDPERDERSTRPRPQAPVRPPAPGEGPYDDFGPYDSGHSDEPPPAPMEPPVNPVRPAPVIGDADVEVTRGGHQTRASITQIRRVSNLSQSLNLSREDLINQIEKTLGRPSFLLPEDPEVGKKIGAFLGGLTSEEISNLIVDLEDIEMAR